MNVISVELNVKNGSAVIVIKVDDNVSYVSSIKGDGVITLQSDGKMYKSESICVNERLPYHNS